MRNTFKQLSGILLILSSVACAQVDPARPDWSGIWGIFGGEMFEKPWLKGSVLTVNWEEIEPAEGEFDFDPLLQKIDAAVGNNQRYVVKVYVDNCPQWLF